MPFPLPSSEAGAPYLAPCALAILSLFFEPNTLTSEKVLDGTEEELISVRLGTFLGTIVCVKIILQLVATSDLPQKDIPERQLFWDVGNTRDDRLPIVNERT